MTRMSPNRQRARRSRGRINRHPAARRRAAYRVQRRLLVTFGVGMVRAGAGTPVDFLAPLVIAVICKHSPGLAYSLRRTRPPVWEVVAADLAAILAALAAVATGADGPVVGADQSRATDQARRTVTRPVRGPNPGPNLARIRSGRCTDFPP